MSATLPDDFAARLVRDGPDAVIYADAEGRIRFLTGVGVGALDSPPGGLLRCDDDRGGCRAVEVQTAPSHNEIRIRAVFLRR